MPDFLFRGPLSELDPELFDLAQVEAERQYRKLILIPSESAAPLAVRELLASAFQNIYAEGYPDEDSRWMSEAELLDHEMRLAHYRRYSDPRYYKGVEYADAIEALARRRCAELFAANGVSADELYVNVQPLSGAPANNAVYHALVEPGDTVMGLNLLHGGHLTHGSPVNRSGKYYNAIHYTVDPETERIDYDAAEAIAREHSPKIIIAGYSSYSWAPDWSRFRQIADACGAYLLADIAHVAGLVAAGAYPSPFGFADVITFTTHKSLCGPRGAVVITASKKLARSIDRAVFPGEQGGPHMNTVAAQALTFKLAATESFRELQHQIVRNCVALNDAIAAEGLRIPFGGTNTHLTNVDCKSVTGPDGTPLSGDIAARVLDIAGIVVNRQTIPGDKSALNPSGIRLGTPWITQRGFDEGDSRQLGGLIAQVLKACMPYSYGTRRRPLQRSRIEFDVLNQVKMDVRDLALSKGIDFEPAQHGYPHFYYLDDPAPPGETAEIGLRGAGAEEMIRFVTSARPGEAAAGTAIQATLEANGETVPVGVERAGDGEWRLTVPASTAPLVLTWLRDLSDGYVPIDPDDLERKAPGPVAVSVTGAGSGADGHEVHDGADKPWYVGARPVDREPLPSFTWIDEETDELRRTALYEPHKRLGAKMIPFAGWEMPVWYSSVLEEHQAVRAAAGLFDVSHMGVYQVEGEGAQAFLDSVVANDVSALDVGESHYTQFLDPEGRVLDDAMVYRVTAEAYMVVVNAANDDKMWSWLTGVHEGHYRVDEARPWARAYGLGCRLRNLRSPEAGPDMRVDLALQGPASRDILLALGCDEATAAALKSLPWAGVMHGTFGGHDLIVSRTGYTGERVAYELFVHPEESPALWQALLEAGEPMGLKPAGLGARDSLRTEAGLPLYGHEMAGELALGVGDAGFAGYVKTYKPWFVGRSAFLAQETARQAEIVRFRFNDKGMRMAHYGDALVDRRGRVVGTVTSCAVDREGYLLGQAYVRFDNTDPGTELGVLHTGGAAAAKEALAIGDRVEVPAAVTVLTRFPK